MGEADAWIALQSAMQDDGEQRTLDRATVRRIRAIARPHRPLIVAFLILTIVGAAIGVSSPVVAGLAVNAIIDGGDRRPVVSLALVIALLAIADAGVGLWGAKKSAQLGARVMFDLRCRVYEHVQTMPVAFFNRTRTGSLVSRLKTDVIEAQRAFTSALSGIVGNVAALGLTMAVMLTLSWQITLLALALLPCFLVPARRYGAKVGALQRDALDRHAAINSQMVERFSASGATLVKLFGRPIEEAAAFRRRAGRLRDVNVRAAVATEGFLRALTLMSGLASALIFGLGGYLAVEGGLKAGTVVTMALLLSRLYAPLTALATARLDVVVAMVAFERVFEVLDLEPGIREVSHPKSVPRGPVSVEFDRVYFRYPRAEEVSLPTLAEIARRQERLTGDVLHGVSFRVEPGQMVALVGASGSCKSTLASLVPRLYDVAGGSVRLAGIDVRELAFDSIRSTVGVVTQDGHLFHDTIAANLRYAAAEATDEELWDVLRQALLETVVAALPDGLATVIGERGYRLSGGERQRLAIARVLLARPPVVVLDEATAHLDADSERAVQEALAHALDTRTALVIAHRLSTIRAADQIVVLEDGRIIEHGTHRELLDRHGRYAGLYRTQHPGVAQTMPAAGR